MAKSNTTQPIAVCLTLTRAISRAKALDDIYDAALDALAQGLDVSRASVLLFDADRVMRFKASRGLSETYRRAVEGHTPWTPDTSDAQPVVVVDVMHERSLQPVLRAIVAEGIAAMAFIPLVSAGRVIGKFMIYFNTPRELTADELQLAGVIAAQVAFAVTRVRAEAAARHAEEQSRRSEERLRTALDVTTRRKEAELARLAAAEEANRLKDEFLATLSHELRTPLNAIVGWVQVLQQGDMASPDRVAHAIEVIGRNARLQAQLIDDILDVTRIVAGKLDIERRPLLIPPVVEAVVAGLLPAAGAKHIALSRDVPDHLPPVEGDAKRLHQVLSNILANALKFTADGGLVRVSCRVDRNVIVIDVQDSGAGIATDFLPFVFDRFRQADERSTRRHGGLGLGLAIARHLVEQHGGEIHAHSDGPGRGSTFSVCLPVAAGPRALIASREVPAVSRRRLSSLKVLVVDDDADSRELLRAWLERCGAEVSACDSTASAVAALDAAPVHLMVADLGMSGDGYGLIEHVRQTGGGYAGLPAIAVSAFARAEDRHKALSAGFDGYCSKPLDLPAFLRTVDAVLGHTDDEVCQPA